MSHPSAAKDEVLGAELAITNDRKQMLDYLGAMRSSRFNNFAHAWGIKLDNRRFEYWLTDAAKPFGTGAKSLWAHIGSLPRIMACMMTCPRALLGFNTQNYHLRPSEDAVTGQQVSQADTWCLQISGKTCDIVKVLHDRQALLGPGTTVLDLEYLPTQLEPMGTIEEVSAEGGATATTSAESSGNAGEVQVLGPNQRIAVDKDVQMISMVADMPKVMVAKVYFPFYGQASEMHLILQAREILGAKLAHHVPAVYGEP